MKSILLNEGHGDRALKPSLYSPKASDIGQAYSHFRAEAI